MLVTICMQCLLAFLYCTCANVRSEKDLHPVQGVPCLTPQLLLPDVGFRITEAQYWKSDYESWMDGWMDGVKSYCDKDYYYHAYTVCSFFSYLFVYNCL